MLKLYDFSCKECSHTFEKLAQTTQGVECPLCGSLQTERVHSPTSFKVTGQGTFDKRMKV